MSANTPAQGNLGNRNAALFLLSQGVTLFGSSLSQFAVIWFVTKTTSSGAWVSVLTVGAYVPQFLISFFSGVWADRYSKKLLIALSDAGIAAVTLVMLLLLPHLEQGTPLLTALVLLSVVRSVGTGLQTPAVNAAVPALVPEEKLMKFNGIFSTVQSLVQFAAPAAAGVLLSFGSLKTALLADVLTAAAGIALLCALKLPHTPEEGVPGLLPELKAGFLYVKHERFLRRLLTIYGGFIFLCVPAGFLATLFVSRFYGNSYGNMTLVEVIGFLGMTAGGLLIGTRGGFPNRVKTLAVGMAAFGALAAGMGAVLNFPVYLVLMALYGVALTMVQTASTTLLQENTSPEMHGRMFGLFGAMYAGFLPLGMAVFGPLSDVISLRPIMIGSDAALLLMALWIFGCRDFYRHLPEKAEAAAE